MKKILSILCFLIMTHTLAEEKNVAIAKLIKGNVKEIYSSGESNSLKKSDWVKEGSVIKTENGSFIQLKFVDNSVMNVGPGSEVKIERFSKSEPGVINVLKGKIRSQVTKNYLEMEKGKSKLFVKSKSAVMGIRGTDFLFTASGATGNTTAVLFEGSVVFNKIDSDKINNNDLERVVSRGRHIMPGQFSVASSLSPATVPAKLSSRQFNKLFKNKDLTRESKSERPRILAKKSVVPPGLNGAVVSGSGEGITSGLRKIGSVDIKDSALSNQDIQNSKGFVKGSDFKPVDGSLVHLESGTIIPVPNDAEFDKATGEWVSGTNGGVDKGGSYVAPEGYVITEDGKMIKEVVDQELQKQNKVVEVIIDAKPLDQNESLDKLPTVVIDASEVNKGHEPAAGSGVEPVVEPINNELPQDQKKRKPSSEGDLPVPPLPVGTTFRPQTYNVLPPLPTGGGAQPAGSKTSIKVNIRNH